jgi:glycosyltransferase involved in cell wall biosynthesis
MIKLSVIIITLNEEQNIGRCLDSVQEIADEILVVDSQSTDKTEEICISKGARVVQHPFKNFVEQKNFATQEAQYDHVFSIDADEYVSEELSQSILKIKENWQYDAYEMKRLNNYCGQWIKHSGWYPGWKPRIFDRNKGVWDGIFVHETLKMDEGTTMGQLKGDLLHHAYDSISEHFRKTNHYTDLTAKEAFLKGKKSNILKICFSPIVRFFRDYIIKGGFRDGIYGYIICKISAQAAFLKYSKLHQMWHNEKLKKLNN